MVRELFAQYGQVESCRVLPAKKNNKLSALVKFTNVEEATWVVENIHKTIPNGLEEPISVRYAAGGAPGNKGAAPPGNGAPAWKEPPAFPMATPTAARQPMRPQAAVEPQGECTMQAVVDGLYASGAMPGSGIYQNDENTLYIAGLPADCSDLDLYKVFSPFGAIACQGVRVIQGQKPRGIGFVNFLEAMAAELAIETLNGCQLPDGSTLQVKIKSPGFKGKDGKGKGKSKQET